MKFWLLTIAIALSACSPKMEPEADCNFVQNSQMQRVSWKAKVPVEMYIHSSVPIEYHSAIRNAMAQWEYKYGRALFRVVGIDDQSAVSGAKDGRSVIYYNSTWEPERNREQGRTTIYWVGDVVGEADIRINAENFSFFVGDEPQSQKVDFESLLVHELGHVLGLKHNDTNGSVMATTLASASFRRTPDPVDISSLTCEYN